MRCCVHACLACVPGGGNGSSTAPRVKYSSLRSELIKSGKLGKNGKGKQKTAQHSEGKPFSKAKHKTNEKQQQKQSGDSYGTQPSCLSRSNTNIHVPNAFFKLLDMAPKLAEIQPPYGILR